MQAIGIKRAIKHSPNHKNNDATIFQLVADQLSAAGVQVRSYHEHEFLKLEHTEADYKEVGLIFSMSRNPALLASLSIIEQRYGDKITMINSPEGIAHCFRSNITRIMLDNGIPTAPSAIMPTTGYDLQLLQSLDHGKGTWMKRGDFHAIIKEDVVFAASPAEAEKQMRAFNSRGIEEVVVSTHLGGDLIKFYGVGGTDFFHWLYPYDKGHYKYKEFQAINGQTHYFNFDSEQLRLVADKTATQSGVPIYGGDAVIDENGQIAIIDFNDWPSFAPCRDQAAAAITARLLQALDPSNLQKVNKELGSQA